MIAYTMIGTHDLDCALRFYTPLFECMGLDVCWQDAQCTAWGRRNDRDQPRFFVGRPFDGQPASVGNGTMTAFRHPTPAQVDALYALALRHGGSDAGAPGWRPQYGPDFYAAYVRDPEGHKLAFVVFPNEPCDASESAPQPTP